MKKHLYFRVMPRNEADKETLNTIAGKIWGSYISDKVPCVVNFKFFKRGFKRMNTLRKQVKKAGMTTEFVIM